jgi:uncharacterized protein YrrD
MLNSARRFDGATVLASDGDAGTVKDLYFDDERWTVRYLVVQTSGWLNARRVLVSPFSVDSLDCAAGGMQVFLDLAKEQLRNSPDFDTDKPVSRQHEMEFLGYYGFPYYWAGPMAWGYAAYPILGSPERPGPVAGEPTPGRVDDQERDKNDPHLRSSQEVIGYHIGATDDSVGHVEDFLIDDKDWSIRFMVVDTRNWWPGKKVLIPPERITAVNWQERRIEVDITRAAVEASPEYDPGHPPPGGTGGGLYRMGDGTHSRGR